MKPCDQNIDETINLAKAMVELAIKGDSQRKDSGCGILYGVILDSAYKIMKLAEMEKDSHIKKGLWTDK